MTEEDLIRVSLYTSLPGCVSPWTKGPGESVNQLQADSLPKYDSFTQVKGVKNSEIKEGKKVKSCIAKVRIATKNGRVVFYNCVRSNIITPEGK